MLRARSCGNSKSWGDRKTLSRNTLSGKSLRRQAEPATGVAPGPADPASAAGYGRPKMIEDASNRLFIHPLADGVARLAIARGISANVLSFLGLGFGLLAAMLYGFLPRPLFVLGALAAMVLWHVLDGADGKVARATGTASAFGRLMDGICDHLVFGAVYAAFVVNLLVAGSDVSVLWLAIAAALSHALQAAAYEERRQKYQRRRAGRSRDGVHEKLLLVHGKRSFLAALYDKGQKLLAGPDSGLDEALERLREAPDGAARAVTIVDRTAPMVRAWGILNANKRTLLITVFAFLGEPATYFLLEVTVFNIVLLFLILGELWVERQLARTAHDPARATA